MRSVHSPLDRLVTALLPQLLDKPVDLFSQSTRIIPPLDVVLVIVILVVLDPSNSRITYPGQPGVMPTDASLLLDLCVATNSSL